MRVALRSVHDFGCRSANRTPKLRLTASWRIVAEPRIECKRRSERSLAYVARPDRFRFAACLSRFNPSRARCFAVRTSAAASDALLARAERSSGVMFLADALPPCRPNMRAISVMAARTSGGIFMPSIVHLTAYGENKRRTSWALRLRNLQCDTLQIGDHSTSAHGRSVQEPFSEEGGRPSKHLRGLSICENRQSVSPIAPRLTNPTRIVPGERCPSRPGQRRDEGGRNAESLPLSDQTKTYICIRPFCRALQILVVNPR